MRRSIGDFIRVLYESDQLLVRVSAIHPSSYASGGCLIKIKVQEIIVNSSELGFSGKFGRN